MDNYLVDWFSEQHDGDGIKSEKHVEDILNDMLLNGVPYDLAHNIADYASENLDFDKIDTHYIWEYIETNIELELFFDEDGNQTPFFKDSFRNYPEILAEF
jgi:hypothetical protein